MSAIEFYFDFGSPTAYLAYKRLQWITKEYNAEVQPIPVLLGGIFKATGNRSPVETPAKGKWMFSDLVRYAKLYQAKMAINPFFPINTIYLMRGAIYAQQQGFMDTYMDAVYDAIWADKKNMGDLEVVTQVLTDAGIDAGALLEAVNDASIKDELRVNTEKAVERGLFGCPTMFYKDEMFFGQDRLFFIENMLQQGA